MDPAAIFRLRFRPHPLFRVWDHPRWGPSYMELYPLEPGPRTAEMCSLCGLWSPPGPAGFDIDDHLVAEHQDFVMAVAHLPPTERYAEAIRRSMGG